MYKFGRRSLKSLYTCDNRLVTIANKAIQHVDFTVLQGFRPQEEQDAAFANGASSVRWPNGKHNIFPSLAFDVAPYPIDWEDIRGFNILAGKIFAAAEEIHVTLRWGGFWEDPFDPGHFEIVEDAK